MSKKTCWGIIFLLLIFVIITTLNFFGYFTKANLEVCNFFLDVRTPELNNLFLSITYLGDKYFVAIVVALTMLYLWWKNRLALKFSAMFETLVCGTSALAAVLVGNFIKVLLAIERPLDRIGEWNGFSFPSGHTTLSTLMMGLLWIFVFSDIKNNAWRKFSGLICYLLPFLVGVSRLYLGAHWLADVFGGWLLGMIFILVVVKINKNSHKFQLA